MQEVANKANRTRATAEERGEMKTEMKMEMEVIDRRKCLSGGLKLYNKVI